MQHKGPRYKTGSFTFWYRSYVNLHLNYTHPSPHIPEGQSILAEGQIIHRAEKAESCRLTARA